MSPFIRKKGQGQGITQAMASELRGCQSVRTTFKLSEGAIHAVSIVAAHLGIKQKSLFDHMMEDLEVLRSVASEVQSNHFKRPHRVQKTFVISRKSLESLERISKTYETPRDILVEISVQKLLPIIEQEKRQHEKRKIISADLKKHVEAGRKLLSKTNDILGFEDPVSEKISSAIATAEIALRQIEAYVEKGKIIEEFP